jgi:hypothetical protein
MELQEFIYTIFTSAIVSSMAVLWFKFKFQYSVKHEYDKNIEKLKNELELRKKTELIAELLSEWLSFPEKQSKLNKLTFKAFLWLPDEIASNLSKLLSHENNAPDVRDTLIEIRKYLLNKNTTLKADEIIIFTQENTRKSSVKSYANIINLRRIFYENKAK